MEEVTIYVVDLQLINIKYIEKFHLSFCNWDPDQIVDRAFIQADNTVATVNLSNNPTKQTKSTSTCPSGTAVSTQCFPISPHHGVAI